jgi:hypothetical protein
MVNPIAALWPRAARAKVVAMDITPGTSTAITEANATVSTAFVAAV